MLLDRMICQRCAIVYISLPSASYDHRTRHLRAIFVMGDRTHFFISTCAAGAVMAFFLASSPGANVVAGTVGESERRGLARPLDIPAERLERPRPEQDQSSPSQSSPVLSQAEVLRLAKAAAKKELGKRVEDYEVRSVIFASSTGIWSVTFEHSPLHRLSGGCLLVLVHDNDKTADHQHCR